MSPAAVSVLLALASVSAPLPDQAVYKWKFEKGRPFYQEVTNDVDQTMKVGGQDVKMAQRHTFVYCFTPVKQDGDEWVLRQTIEALKMEVDVGGNKIVFDSTKPEASDTVLSLAKFYKAMVGWECRLTLDGNRKVIRLEGAEELNKRLAKEVPEAAAAGLDHLMSEEALRETTSHTFNALPGRRVEKGESWSRTSRMDLGFAGRMVCVYEYVHAGKDGKLDKFAVQSVDVKHHPPVPGAPTKLPFTLKKADFKSKKAGGVILFDPVRGRVEKAEFTMETDGSLSIDIGGQVTDVTLSQTQKTTTRTTDSNPLKK